MKKTIVFMVFGLFLIYGGTVMAADGGQPAILASLDNSAHVTVLDNESLDQIQGAFFMLPDGHPSIQDAIEAFLALSIEDRRALIQVHVEYLKENLPDLRSRRPQFD